MILIKNISKVKTKKAITYFALSSAFLILINFPRFPSEIATEKTPTIISKTVFLATDKKEEKLFEVEESLVQCSISNACSTIVKSAYMDLEKTTEVETKNKETKNKETEEKKTINVSQTQAKKVVVKTKAKPIVKNHWNLSLSESEIDLLSRILWVEARGECDEGQYAVVQVVLNRIAFSGGAFGKDLYEVLSSEGQFKSWNLKDTATGYEHQREIVKNVLAEKALIIPNNVFYFATTQLTNNAYKKIGNHWFCYQ